MTATMAAPAPPEPDAPAPVEAESRGSIAARRWAWTAIIVAVWIVLWKLLEGTDTLALPGREHTDLHQRLTEFRDSILASRDTNPIVQATYQIGEWCVSVTDWLSRMIAVPDFPNMFLLYGPNTNGGTGSVVNTIECGMNHVLAALEQLDRADARRIEVRRQAADAFDAELRSALAGTVWHSGCTNWYVDERGHDPNQWPWTWTTYRRRTETIEPGTYELVA